jgi:hypothetical protein
VPAAESGGRADTQQPRCPRAACPDCRVSAGHFVEDALAVFQIGGAFVGQRKLACRAQHQFHAEPFFQGIDAPTNHGRLHAFELGNRRKTALSCDGNEGLNLLETVHFVLLVKD